MKVSGYYDLQKKLNHCKKKYEQDTSRLQSQIKKQNEIIKALKEWNKTLKSRENYQLWLKEREERIKQIKENSILLDEIHELKKKLTNEIELSIKDTETEVSRS